MNKVALQKKFKGLENSYKAVFEEYLSRNGKITSLLLLFDPDGDIDFSSFSNKDILDNFETLTRPTRVSSSDGDRGVLSEEDLESFFESLYEYLKIRAEIISHEKQNNAMKKVNSKKKRFLILFVLIFALVAVAAIICTVLHLSDPERYRSLNIVGDIIGTVDLVIGILAFIVERVEDAKGDKLAASGDQFRECPTEKNAEAFTKIYGDVIKQHGICNINIIK